MTEPVFERLVQRLEAAAVPFEVQRHEPVFTSEEAARVRGAPLSSGAKALICKADRERVMIVIPADLRLASKRVRKEQSLKSLRFATQDEVRQWTRLRPGSIPPFGSLFELPTWCDARLADEPTINFNAGDHSISIRMRFEDYQRVERPQLGEFGESTD